MLLFTTLFSAFSWVLGDWDTTCWVVVVDDGANANAVGATAKRANERTFMIETNHSTIHLYLFVHERFVISRT